MENAGEVLRKFYAAAVKNNSRACLTDDMVFEGLFPTAAGDQYMKTFCRPPADYGTARYK